MVQTEARTDLVLEEEAPKGPDGTEDKEEFVDLFAGVGRCVLGRQLCLQQVTQRLDHTDLLDRSDHLEPVCSVHVQQDGDIALKEDCQIRLFRLHFAFIDPALDIPWRKTQ